MTSTPNELTSRLRRRLEADHRQIEETAESELRRLGGSLSALVNDALRTVDADTGSAVGRLSALLRQAWLLPLAVGLSLSLGIAGGNWAGPRWLWMTIEQQIEALAVLRVDIEEARATLTRIEDTTWGQELTEVDGERFVVLPAGTPDSPGLDGGRAACLEAVERVRRLYDRARAAVDGGLGDVVRAVRDGTAAALRAGRSLAVALRAAGRGEQRTLRQRIEQLSGQLRCLDADDRTLAETLRGP